MEWIGIGSGLLKLVVVVEKGSLEAAFAGLSSQKALRRLWMGGEVGLGSSCSGVQTGLWKMLKNRKTNAVSANLFRAHFFDGKKK